ncbi:hypothetical protein K0038_01743 [Pseudomonas syringae]|nr:hypothetical protein [Pseudomonas syringae]
MRDALRGKRTRSVPNGMRRGASHDSWDYRSLRSSVGMQVATLCVAKEDAERPERHATRSVAR